MKIKYLITMDEQRTELKKKKQWLGYAHLEVRHIDYAETIGYNLCLNPFKVAKLLYSLDRKAVKAYGKFFELYPTNMDKIMAVINF